MSRLTTIIICFILSIVLGFLLLWPQYQKLGEARWQVKEKEIERNNQEEYFVHVESLSQDLKGYEEQLSKIFSALPSNYDIPDLLNYISNASNQNGMTLDKIISFSAEQPKKTSTTPSIEETVVSKAKEITIEFGVSGDYTALKNFIATLEKSARIIEVDSISLKNKSIKSENENLLSLIFKIRTYYY